MEYLGIITAMLVTLGSCSAECDQGWKSFNSNCFKMFEEKKSWDDAKSHCEETGAHLVKIESADENIFLLNSFLQLLSNETNREAWTGLSDKMEEGEFVWTDGSTPEYTNWAAEQPNDEDDQQDCAEIANGVFWPGGLPQIGVWNDFQCKRALMFICEKDE
ncbi:alpha-N-acetylgalactosamine-specific lectin-like isoform X1 [Stylophora pistillata]|uniref:alpha-N-acetylgalactosamine-specific lectin-like isoform X1 n=1 Tax=Stylophora pistillata TaxID=50429 RepID=UPI000C049F70|nr:alpha-N-acetylgalactosamine-specific lectin-like isoform X1 [Stylophora pistillata]XP_022801548.1 alpha-N-acetylgalactosamine-specific lectin-like isoform X1 [Stylophora pistillata]